MELFSNSIIEDLRRTPPEQEILQVGNTCIRAGILFQESCALAAFLQKNGLRRGDKVLIAAQPGPDFVRVMYACMLLGAMIAIIDPEMGADNYREKLKQFSPAHAFVDSRLLLLNEHPILNFIIRKIKPYLPQFPRIRGFKVFTTGPRLPLLRKHTHIRYQTVPGLEFTFKAIDEQEAFLLVYTSGTLSEPKGVVHTYDSINASLELLAQLFQKPGNNTAIATHLPHFMLLGIKCGLKVHVWDNRMSGASKLAFMECYQISTLFGPPSDYLPLLDAVSKAGRNDFGPLRNLYLGSAPVHAGFLKRLLPFCGDSGVYCLYGMTENLMVCLTEAREKLEYTGAGDLVGRPFAGVQLEIAADGEVCLDSPQRFHGYWGMVSVAGKHASGDLGFLDAQGRLVLSGRKKDMIIRRNFNIYPGLYEPTINKMEGVQEAVMIGIYDAARADEQVFLLVECTQPISVKALHKALASGPYSIDREALPDRIVLMPLPRSGRQQKVNKAQLREICKKMI